MLIYPTGINTQIYILYITVSSTPSVYTIRLVNIILILPILYSGTQRAMFMRRQVPCMCLILTAWGGMQSFIVGTQLVLLQCCCFFFLYFFYISSVVRALVYAVAHKSLDLKQFTLATLVSGVSRRRLQLFSTTATENILLVFDKPFFFYSPKKAADKLHYQLVFVVEHLAAKEPDI